MKKGFEKQVEWSITCTAMGNVAPPGGSKPHVLSMSGLPIVVM